jgi:hypothetical protein
VERAAVLPAPNRSTTMSNPFDIFPDDDLDAVAPSTTRETLTNQRAAQGFIAPAAPSYEERCVKCRGTGRFTSRSGRVLGECFACKGAGFNTFKTDAATRAKGRERAAVKAEQKAVDKQAAIEAFRVEQPAVWAWLQENDRSDRPFEFATEMLAKLLQYGELSVNQLNGCLKCVAAREAKRAEWQAKRAAEQATAPKLDKLTAAFDRAIANKAKARLYFGSVTVSPAKANSANPGALYVKDGETYLGKIVDGRFLASRDCTDAVKATVLELLADPAKAAIKYGKELIRCCCCGAELDNKLSRELGIGPICREKWGF